MPVAPVSAALRALRSSGPQLLCPAFCPPPNNSLSLCGCYRMRRCLLTALRVYDVMVQVRLKEVPSAASAPRLLGEHERLDARVSLR